MNCFLQMDKKEQWEDALSDTQICHSAKTSYSYENEHIDQQDRIESHYI